MVALWIIFGLVLATVSVASLAAFFSVVGIAALFSGAWLAVCAMATSLEVAKFVLAAYLHQQWDTANKVFRSYLVFAIVVLSLITSMGVFGFLSDAYQSASSALEAQNIKIQTEKNKQASITNEIARINKSIDEIPITRISRKMKARAEAEPLIRDLNKQYEEIEKNLSSLSLEVLEIKKKVGPLVYIAKSFNVDIDTTVKYLIFIFVLVFDPLAICLVIALTQAVESRKKGNQVSASANQETAAVAPTIAPAMNTVAATITPDATPSAKSVQFETTEPEQAELIEMSFAEPESDKEKVG